MEDNKLDTNTNNDYEDCFDFGLDNGIDIGLNQNNEQNNYENAREIVMKKISETDISELTGLPKDLINNLDQEK